MSMKHLLQHLIVAGAALLSLLACQNDSQLKTAEDFASQGYYLAQESLVESGIRVVGADQTPVSGAYILVGYAPGNPFEGNEFTTDSNGYIEIPAHWKAPLPVTIEAENYIRTTFDSVQPYTRAFQISKKEGEHSLQVKGETTDFPNVRRDGKVDFSLVMPAFSRRDLLSFDLSSIISPESDTIEVLGQSIEIPSNITLPRQQETYVVPVRLNKPDFRLFVRQPGTYQIVASHAQFPMKKVVDQIRAGRSVFDVINDFSFIGGGIKEVQVFSNEVSADIAVNEMAYDSTISFQAPSFDNSKMVFGLAAVELDGRLFPSDLKIFDSNESLDLQVPSQGKLFKVSLLTHRVDSSIDVSRWEAAFANGEDSIFINETLKILNSNQAEFQQMSISLQPGEDARPPQFLPLVAPPQVEDGRILLQAPGNVSGIQPIATYVILSEVETIQNGEIESERRTRLWELVSTSWVNSVDLPEMDFERKPNRTYRWEVLFLGQESKGIDSNPATLDEITHVTRNAFNF